VDNDVLRRTPLFAALDDAAAAALRATMTQRTVARSEVVFSEGEPGDELFIIVDGKIKLGQTGLRPWLSGRPEVAEALLQALAQRLRRTNEAMADLVFSDVPGRVAKALLELADKFGQEQPDGSILVAHDLTQEELAQLVGASRETVNKSLADFASRGWIRLEARSVILLDSARVARRAG